MYRSRRAWLGLLTVGLAGACERPGAIPGRVPGDGLGIVSNVPYPMADGERIEGAGRAVLSQASFVFIALGAPPDDRDHALPERFAWDGEDPLMVVHHVEPVGPQGSAWQQLQRLALGGEASERGRAAPVEAQEVETLGLMPPAKIVWLVGPRGSCRAEVGEPVVAAYDGAEDTIMVGYTLSGCSGRAWAQIGIVADAIPIDFRWVPATQSAAVIGSAGGSWDDPLAALLESPGWSPETGPSFEARWVREIPEASPRVLQIHHALLGEPPDEDNPAWCDVDVAWTRSDGWYNGRWIDSVQFSSEAVGPFLLGAFLNGTQVDAVIYDDRLDGLVMIPPGPLDDMDEPTAWREVFVPTGRYDAAALASWGVEPARGPSPTGLACVPQAPPP